MKRNKILVLLLVVIMTMNISFAFADPDTSTGSPVDITKDKPERIIDFEIVTKGNVVINYLDESSKAIAAQENFNVDAGTYTYKAKNIKGYVLMNDESQTVTIKTAGETKTIDFKYKKAKGTVIVDYMAGNKKLKDTERYTVDLGSHKYTAKSFKDYTLSSAESKTVNITRDGQTENVLFSYDAVQAAAPVAIPVTAPQPTPTPAQVEIKKGIVRGYLKTDKGEAIANAKIELDSQAATTDENGYFEFSNVAVGSYKLYLTDEKYMKDPVMLKSFVVKENSQLTAEYTGEQLASLSQGNGMIKAAQVSITDSELEKDVEMIVALKVKGKIIVKYILNGKLLDQDEMDNLDMGKHQVHAKAFKGYKLITAPAEKEVELTEDIPELTLVVEFEYTPARTFPVIPIVLAGFAFLALMVMIKKHIVVYAIEEANGKETLRRIRNKRVKITKDGVQVELSREIRLANDSPLKVVFLKNISRRIGGKEIKFLNGKEIIHTAKAPVQMNKEFDVIINH